MKVLPFVILLGLGLVPLWIQSPYALHIFILLFIATAMGEGWNIIGGYAGQYSVGHAAYSGVGAYGTMILLQNYHVPPWIGIWVAIVLAVLISLVIGSITFRLRGPYFVLASIAVAEIVRLSALNWKSLTNGAEGILVSDLPPFQIGGHVLTDWSSKTPYYYLGLAMAAFTVLVNVVVKRSKLGYYLQAIREDQDAASSLGIPLARYKNTGLVISAALTALAGSFTALYVGFISPDEVLGLSISVEAVLICIIGGVGTVSGPLVGAVVLVLLSESLRSNLLAEGLFKLGVPENSAVGSFLGENLAHAHVLIYGLLV
ncbi:MAG TPA: branched-chain amino acid ABC transporter permease, partial [Myxococcales bacterium]|nr:branched-chain amino acid ABC transporter permease [Myxococcales bacterium]